MVKQLVKSHVLKLIKTCLHKINYFVLIDQSNNVILIVLTSNFPAELTPSYSMLVYSNSMKPA